MSATASSAETTSVARLFGSNVRLYDLTQELSRDTQCHPNHPQVAVYPYETHAHSKEAPDYQGFSFSTDLLIMSDHAGTHVDGINHMSPAPDAASIDQMSLSTFCGDAICLDLSSKEPGAGITIEDLQAALAAAGEELKEDDVVLLYTGHYERTGGTAAYLSDYPGLEPESATWLIDQGVKLFGGQAPSVDKPSRGDYPVHQICGEKGITHFENVGPLAAIAGKRFTLFGFPLAIRAGTGSPVRLVAAIQE